MTLRLKLFYYFNIVGLFAVRAQEIASLQLINTMTNAPVLTLIDGGVVDLQALKLSSNALNIAAIPLTAGTIGSVRFGFDSISSFRVENSAPFAFCGDDNAKFKACPELLQNVGRSVRVSATPFSGTKQSGSAGSTKQVTFTIVEGGTVPVATPVSGPVPTFIATPVATPISTPVKVPVRSPVVAPVVAPGAPPVAPPVIIPAATPVQSPSVIAPEHVPECPPLNYPQNIGTGSSTDLQAAMNALAAHISGTTVLSQESLAQQRTLFQNNAIRLPTNLSLMQSALSLVDAYESRIGPLFVSGPSVGGFERNTPASPDGKELERAMITVQQGILDHIFQGSQWVNEDVIPNPLPSLVDACAAPLLRSRKWLTAKYFPGMIDPPVDESVVHTVMVNATKTPYWGKVVSFATIENIKPLDGLYLAPGAIATVTVPDTMVNAGFLLQVGANTIDNKSKSVHRRMDRITTTFVVDKMQVTVANPLGGGLYLRIPYLANLGLVSLSIKGGVVASPRVQQTRLHTTTMAEWESMKVSAPGPWVNIETDNFLATVPRNWIVSRDFSFVNQLVTDYKKAMDGVSALFGYSPDYRNNYVVHVGIDLYIKFGSYGIGYPQVNDVLSANSNGVISNTNHWMVNSAIGSDVFYHELGHAQLFSKYRGEVEAAVNVPYIYVRNVIFGDDIDTATRYSFSTARFDIDAAAINWMIAENFRAGKQMDYSNTEYDEFRYQHRGYAKYPDMARLFGWQVISNMFHQENLDAMSGSLGPAAWLSVTDQRTLKFSIAAGEDLTPLIHFWGIFPEDSMGLKNAMESYGLYRSAKVRAQIERYASIVPMDQAAFIAHFDEVWPGKRDVTSGCGSILYGCGWYNDWYPKWTTTLALQTVAAVESIVNLYWPIGDAPSSSPTSLPTPAPCLDTRTGSYCRRQKRNNKCSTTLGCDLTCGKCQAGRRGLLSSQALSTQEAEASPESKMRLRQSRDAREFGDGISLGGAASRQLAPPSGGPPGLSNEGPPGWDPARQRSDLDKSRGAWKRAALINYNFELERDFFGPDGYKGPFVVTVRNGLVTNVVHKVTGNPVNPAVAIDIRTIDQLLDAIDSDIDNVAVKYEHAKYDPLMGFPFDIFRVETFVDFYNGERSEVAQTFVRNLTIVN